MDYKNMLDSELASVMVNYINRTEHLMQIISRYMNGTDHGNIPVDKIRTEYAQLKNEIREDAHYLRLGRNYRNEKIYAGAFSPSIKEAAAFGFTVSVNHKVDQRMYSAVADAHYRLTKYKTLEEWGDLM